MPKNSGSSPRNSKPGSRAQAKKQYFGQKPPKADRKALEALLNEEPTFVLDFLAGIEAGERFTGFYDDQEETWVFMYNLGSAAKGQPERVITGRSQHAIKAVAIVAYWLKTLSLETMFPETESEDEDPF